MDKLKMIEKADKKSQEDLLKEINDEKKIRENDFQAYVLEGMKKYNCILISKREEIGSGTSVQINYSIIVQSN